VFVPHSTPPLNQRQIDFECRPLAELTIDENRDIMLLDDSVDNGQPGASSLIDLLGRVKWLENPLH